VLQKRSMQNNPTEVSRVDDLLALLGDLSQRDTSPAIRAHLSDLSSQRFQQKRVISDAPRTFTKLSASFAVLLLAALGLATAWVLHLRQPPPKNIPAGNEAIGTSSPMSLVKEAHVVPPGSSSMPPSLVSRRSRPKLPPAPNTREIIIRLPYSNSSVDTGTGATIQVSMSQSELLSLGFPLSATLHDRRVIAELTLGDDGLPRAISLPLSLLLIKEEK
jgi:hypothetical protein